MEKGALCSLFLWKQRMQLFYSTHIINNTIELNGDESWHCIKVLRHKTGDRVQVIDGQGTFYTAAISDAHPKHCILTVTEKIAEYKKRPYTLHLAIAPTKNSDRIEWMLEKAVEAGVDEITFLLCKTSERKIIKTDRLKKVVESAVKQSVQAYLPKINELTDIKKFITNQQNFAGKKLIAHCRNNNTPLLNTILPANTNVLSLIGPEGDFATEEIELALSNNFEAVSLGMNRLRTETAGLYVCIAMNYAHTI